MGLNFVYATQILRARLKQTNRVDINVFEESDAQSTSNINNNNGRIFCYFCSRPDETPILLVFAREHADQDISHIFAFYVNKKFKIIQPPERNRFAKKLQKGARLGLEVKLGVVNAATDIPKFLHTSILIQMAEFMLDFSLVKDFVPTRQVTGCVFSSFVCFNNQIPFPSCKPSEDPPNANKIWNHLDNQRIYKKDVNINDKSGHIPSFARVLRIPFQGHLIYGINYFSERSLMIIIPHPSLFKCHEDADEFQSALRRQYKNYRINYIGSTRFYGKVLAECNSSDVLMSILIMLHLPLVAIKQCDIDCLLNDEDNVFFRGLVSSGCSQERIDANIDPVAIEGSSYLPHDFDVDEEWVPTQEVLLAIDMATCQPSSFVQAASSQALSVDSQATIICSQRDIEEQLAEIARLRSIKLSLKYDYPMINAVKPMDDPSNRILKSTDFFQDELNFIIESFNMPARLFPITPVVKLPKLLAIPIERPSKFLMLPVQELGKVVLIIIDYDRLEWGLIDPDPETQRERITFNRVNLIMSHESSQFNDFVGATITIPCSFHAHLPLMHLLMSAYCLCQAFEYAVMLPKRLTYTERRLRNFCYTICRELQVKNAQYNLSNGLVEENGFLKEAAFRALPSLVKFERSVVATNLCLFCDSRSLDKLGTHMKMKHGGQGRSKRERRRWKESL